VDGKDTEFVSAIDGLGIRARAANIVIQDREDRIRLAGELIEYVSKEVLMAVKS